MPETKKNDSNYARAKLFLNGRSQAVRLPKEFRFEGSEVAIHKEGDRIILEPIRKRKWPKGYWEKIARMGKDFEIEPIQELPPDPERESFDDE